VVQLAIFLLAVYGLANAVAVLKIGRYFIGTHKARKGLGRIPYFGDMLYCPPCQAFWYGMAFSKYALSPSREYVVAQGQPLWTSVIMDGLAACAVAYLLHVLAERLGYGVPDL